MNSPLQKLYQMRFDLTNLKQNEYSVVNYYNKIKAFWDELEWFTIENYVIFAPKVPTIVRLVSQTPNEVVLSLVLD